MKDSIVFFRYQKRDLVIRRRGCFRVAGRRCIRSQQIIFYDGENYAQVLDRVLKQAGYEYENAGTLTDDRFYLPAIKNADSGLIDIPDCILNMKEYGITNESAQQWGNDDEWLSEFDYSQGAGWYYFVNNDAPQVGMSRMKATDGAFSNVKKVRMR